MRATANTLFACAVLLAGLSVGGSAADAAREGTACDLLTAEEIEAVQGDRLIDAKASEPVRPQFAIAQCFFSTESFDNSISLEVTRALADAPDGVTPRSFWASSFHKDWEAEADEDSDSAKARAADKAPYAIDGLGDEAFWVGRGGPAGALYVLHGEAFFRLAVGGGGDPDEKLASTTRLARLVLGRL